MVDYLHGPVQHEAFFRKYASKKFMKGVCHLPLAIVNYRDPSDMLSASIILRSWAKKWHTVYLDESEGGIKDE